MKILSALAFFLFCLPLHGAGAKTSLALALHLQKAKSSQVKSCYCSTECVCGCNDGAPCDCRVSRPETPYIAPTAGSYVPRFATDGAYYRPFTPRVLRGGGGGGG